MALLGCSFFFFFCFCFSFFWSKQFPDQLTHSSYSIHVHNCWLKFCATASSTNPVKIGPKLKHIIFEKFIWCSSKYHEMKILLPVTSGKKWPESGMLTVNITIRFENTLCLIPTNCFDSRPRYVTHKKSVKFPKHHRVSRKSCLHLQSYRNQVDILNFLPQQSVY